MLKTFMISAAVSALMVSGALAQADKPAEYKIHRVTESGSVGFLEVQRH